MTEAQTLKKYLVGFDIRASQESYPSGFWLNSRREEYLLNPAIKWPLSVDDMVWPSVFSYKEFTPIVEVKGAVVTTIERERDLGLDLSEIVELYAHHGGKDGIPIAIELLSDQEPVGEVMTYLDAKGIVCGFYVTPTTPTQLPPGSDLLGFDVADGAQLSGLCNCGYLPDETASLGREWTAKLNEFGLLSTLEDAIQFKDVTDKRVAEHAPFWIYALHRLNGLGLK